MLKDPSKTRQERAVALLGKIGAPVLPRLKQLLASPEQYETDLVYEAIGKTGGPGMEALLEILQEIPLDKRTKLLNIIRRARDARAVPVLIKTLPDYDPNIRDQWWGLIVTAACLADLGDPRAVEPIIEALRRHPDSSLMGSLGKFRDPRATTVVLQQAESGKYDMREQAVIALGTLYAGLGSIPGRGQRVPAKSGGSMPPGDEVVKVLQKAGGSGGHLSFLANEALGKIGDVSSIPTLLPLLSSPDEAAQARAAKILESMKWQPTNDSERAAYAMARKDWHVLEAMGTNAEKQLIGALGSTSQDVRKRAVALLVKTGDRLTVASLVRLLEDPGEVAGIKDSLREGLKSLGGPEAEAALEKERRIMVERGRFFKWLIWWLGGIPTVAFFFAARKTKERQDMCLTLDEGQADGTVNPTVSQTGIIGRLVFGTILPALVGLIPIILMVSSAVLYRIELSGNPFSGGGSNPLGGAMLLFVISMYLIYGGGAILAVGLLLSIFLWVFLSLKTRATCFLFGLTLFWLLAWLGALVVTYDVWFSFPPLRG